ncbi:GMC oxidoreductase-domain-containing protein [Apiospora phragmitis]|uniref:GMC oxidoreductase-domain-containing protein n=1 Tax=Apiospora phragmitis TaxID=2905665 RepID=A0ABR1U6P6_9PEZI
MHSGQGPKEVLDKHGIRTVRGAFEIGRNFSDHVSVAKSMMGDTTTLGRDVVEGEGEAVNWV